MCFEATGNQQTANKKRRVHSTGCVTYASSKAQMELPFPFAHKTRNERWLGVGGCGMWDGDGEVMGTLGRSGASRIVSNTMLAQHSARLIAIALPCLQTHSYLAVCPARNCI